MLLEIPQPSFSIYSYLFVPLYLKDIFSHPFTSWIPIKCIFDQSPKVYERVSYIDLIPPADPKPNCSALNAIFDNTGVTYSCLRRGGLCFDQTPSTQISSLSSITTALLQNIDYTTPVLMFLVILVFVNKYAKLYSPGIHTTLNVLAAWDSLTLWQHIALCPLFKTDTGTLEL